MTLFIKLAAVTVLLSLFKLCEFSEITPLLSRNGLISKNTVIKACGSHLADILREVCDSKYYIDPSKRNMKPSVGAEDPDYYYNYDNYLNFDVDSTFPFRMKRASPLIRTIKSKRESKVVDECCKKSCTVEEMIGYCGQ